MERLKIETDPKTFLKYDRERDERMFLQRMREINQQNAYLSAKLHGGKVNLEAPVQEELLAHLGADLREIRNTRDDLRSETAA
jgi:hypothetical protein